MGFIVPVFSWFMCIDVSIDACPTRERHGKLSQDTKLPCAGGLSKTTNLFEETKYAYSVSFTCFLPLCENIISLLKLIGKNNRNNTMKFHVRYVNIHSTKQ